MSESEAVTVPDAWLLPCYSHTNPGLGMHYLRPSIVLFIRVSPVDRVLEMFAGTHQWNICVAASKLQRWLSCSSVGSGNNPGTKVKMVDPVDLDLTDLRIEMQVTSTEAQ